MDDLEFVHVDFCAGCGEEHELVVSKRQIPAVIHGVKCDYDGHCVRSNKLIYISKTQRWED